MPHGHTAYRRRSHEQAEIWHPTRPGPRRAHMLTAEILAWAEQALAADPALRPAALAGPIEANVGVRAHPRSIERALARHRERHSKSR